MSDTARFQHIVDNATRALELLQLWSRARTEVSALLDEADHLDEGEFADRHAAAAREMDGHWLNLAPLLFKAATHFDQLYPEGVTGADPSAILRDFAREAPIDQQEVERAIKRVRADAWQREAEGAGETEAVGVDDDDQQQNLDGWRLACEIYETAGEVISRAAEIGRLRAKLGSVEEEQRLRAVDGNNPPLIVEWDGVWGNYLPKASRLRELIAEARQSKEIDAFGATHGSPGYDLVWRLGQAAKSFSSEAITEDGMIAITELHQAAYLSRHAMLRWRQGMAINDNLFDIPCVLELMKQFVAASEKKDATPTDRVRRLFMELVMFHWLSRKAAEHVPLELAEMAALATNQLYKWLIDRVRGATHRSAHELILQEMQALADEAWTFDGNPNVFNATPVQMEGAATRVEEVTRVDPWWRGARSQLTDMLAMEAAAVSAYQHVEEAIRLEHPEDYGDPRADPDERPAKFRHDDPEREQFEPGDSGHGVFAHGTGVGSAGETGTPVFRTTAWDDRVGSITFDEDKVRWFALRLGLYDTGCFLMTDAGDWIRKIYDQREGKMIFRVTDPVEVAHQFLLVNVPPPEALQPFIEKAKLIRRRDIEASVAAVIAANDDDDEADLDEEDDAGEANSEQSRHKPSTRPEPQAKPDEQLVTLDQSAAMVGRSKRTLETYVGKGLPEPRVKGRGGKPNEYLWGEMRPFLVQTFGRPLPERFPSPGATETERS